MKRTSATARKILAAFAAVLFALSLCALTAFAEEADPATDATVKTTTLSSVLADAGEVDSRIQNGSPGWGSGCGSALYGFCQGRGYRGRGHRRPAVREPQYVR